MERTKILTCPNCGANITNTQNCEYCGSLLVRFVDKGIDISKTSYLDKSRLSGKLLKALKLALSMQKSTSWGVAADIYQRKQHNGLNYYKEIGCVLRSGKSAFTDGVSIPSETNTGLCIIFSNENFQEDELEKFKSLDCFPLFNERPCIDDCNIKLIEYYIDFGDDTEGATQILTDVFTVVYGASEDELECYVNSGYVNLETARQKLYDSVNWFTGNWDDFLQSEEKRKAWDAKYGKTKRRPKKTKEDQKKINRSRFYIASVLLVAALGLYMAFDKLDSLYYGPGGEEWMWTMRCICMILAGLCLLVAVLLYLSILGIDKDYV